MTAPPEETRAQPVEVTCRAVFTRANGTQPASVRTVIIGPMRRGVCGATSGRDATQRVM